MPLDSGDLWQIEQLLHRILTEMVSPEAIAAAFAQQPLQLSTTFVEANENTTRLPDLFGIIEGTANPPRELTAEDLRLFQLYMPIDILIPAELKNIVEAKAHYNPEAKRYDTRWLIKGPSVGYPAFDDRMLKALDGEIARAFIKVFELRVAPVPRQASRSIILEEETDAS